jgi:hypothetical protein
VVVASGELVGVYRGFGCFAAMGFQKHHKKKRFAKKSCRKQFTKKTTKNPKPIFCRCLFLSRFWKSFGWFSVMGIQTKIEKQNINPPWSFFGLDPTTHHGVTATVTEKMSSWQCAVPVPVPVPAVPNIQCQYQIRLLGMLYYIFYIARSRCTQLEPNWLNCAQVVQHSR